MEVHIPECSDREECVPCTLYELMGAYWSSDRFSKEHDRWMDTLSKTVVKSFPDFKTGQHDVPEFLEMFFRLLYDPTSVQHHADLDHMFKTINAAYDSCEQCGHLGQLAEVSRLVLPGSFSDSKTSTTVEDAIRNNLGNSQVHASCANCNTTAAIQYEKIASPPENLFVQIHRGEDTQKIRAQVQFGNSLVIPEELKFGELLKKGKLQYELYAVIFHVGNLASQGHYIIAVKGPNRGWILIDDTDVKVLQETKFFASQQYRRDAYMLAYRRVPAMVKQTKPSSPLSSSGNWSVEARPPKVRLPGPYDDYHMPGWANLEQILSDGTEVIFAFENKPCLLPEIRLAPKSRKVDVRLRLTLPTKEIFEGTGDITLMMQEETKPTGTKPARIRRTARRPRPKRAVSDEPYGEPTVRKSKRNKVN